MAVPRHVRRINTAPGLRRACGGMAIEPRPHRESARSRPALLSAPSSDDGGAAYLLAKQHMMPVLPRNQRKPKNRTRERTAVEYSRKAKNPAVREEADF